MPPDRPDPPDRTPRIAPALLLLAGLMFLYTASATLVFRTDDEHILAARAQSLALWGNLGQTQVFGNTRVQELRAQGDAATEIEPGQVGLGALAYRLARMGDVGGAQAFLLVNVYITSLTALLVLLTVRRLGFDLRVSLLVALLYGTATMVWPYATTGYRDPLAALGWSMALYGWAMVLKDWPKGWWTGTIVMGLGLLAAVLAKNTSFALVASFALTGVIWSATAARSRRGGSRRALLAFGGAAIMVFVAGMLLPASGPFARYSLAYFSFLAGHALSGWNLGLAGSFLGPFLSPAKSIFLFSPAAMLGIVGLVRWRGSRVWFALPAGMSVLFLALLQALFYRELWAGVYGWGLRFMLPALPALAILSAPFLEGALRPGRRGAVILLVALFALGITVQAAAVLVPWLGPVQEWKAIGLDPFRSDAAWSLRYLAIPPQLASLADSSSWQVIGARLARWGSPAAGVLQVLCLLAAAGALGLAVRAAFCHRRAHEPLSVVVLALALLAPMALLVVARADPAWGGSQPEFVEASNQLQSQVQPGDLVLVESYGSSLWAYLLNWWRSTIPWYSLPYDIPGSELASPPEWLSLTVGQAEPRRRVWLLTSTESPGYAASAPQAYLESVRGPAERWMFAGVGTTEIALYR